MIETIEIARKKLSSGFLKLDEITYQVGDKEVKREVINRGDAVCALLFNTKTEKFVFTKQFRPGASSELLEVIAGTMDVEGESAESCMRREIEEESGYKATELKQIFCCYCSPGGTTEKIYIFQAITNGEKVEGSGGGVGDENIEIVEFTEEEMLESEELKQDMKTCLAIEHFKREDLFDWKGRYPKMFTLKNVVKWFGLIVVAWIIAWSLFHGLLWTVGKVVDKFYPENREEIKQSVHNDINKFMEPAYSGYFRGQEDALNGKINIKTTDTDSLYHWVNNPYADRNVDLPDFKLYKKSYCEEKNKKKYEN